MIRRLQHINLQHTHFAQRMACAVLAGMLTTLAFSPFFWLPVLCISMPILCLLSMHAPRKKQAFFLAWCWGMGHFCTSFYWITHALLIDAKMFGWLAPLAVPAISAVLSIYIGILGLALHLLHHTILPRTILSPTARIWCCWLCLPLLWMGTEYLRLHAFTGFPWNMLAYSLAITDASFQAFYYIPMLPLGAILVLASCMPYAFLAKLPRVIQTLSVGGVAGMLILTYLGAMRLQTPVTMVENVMLRIVQANIPQRLKWDAEGRIISLNEHIRLSNLPSTTPLTHIIWPETSMPFPFASQTVYARRLRSALHTNATLITGVMEILPNANTKRYDYYNAVKALLPDATTPIHYYKRHLVPFGEYVPLRAILPLEKITHGSVDFSAGSSAESLQLSDIPPFSVIICYEAVFPELSKSNNTLKAQWLFNPTNDGWFGDSTGPHQHLVITRARAIEQGAPVIRAASTGISAVIDPYGRIIQSIALNTQGVIDTPLPASIR